MQETGLDLHQYLLQQQAEGRMEQEGEFTLDREKALQKIASFQLPFAESWAIKIAQAAVISGSEWLSIAQTSSETQMRFGPQEWDPSLDFQTLFFNPSPSGDKFLDVLRGGLWAAGVGRQCPFSIVFPNSGEKHIWNGKKFDTVPDDSPTLRISVSHRSLADGKGIFLLRSIQAARLNSKMKTALQQSLYTAPLEITIDAVRIDGYAQSPSHGFSEHTYPVRAFALSTGGSPLNLPRSNDRVNRSCHERILPLCRHFYLLDFPKDTTTVGLVTASCGRFSSGDSSSWETPKVPSFLFWVRHGVIIQKEQIDVGSHCVTVALHVNADDLPPDFSGFALLEEKARPVRDQVLKKTTTYLSHQEIDFELTDRVWYNRKKALSGAALVLGGAFKLLVAGPVGATFLVAGVMGGFITLDSIEKISNGLKAGYESLRVAWNGRFPE